MKINRYGRFVMDDDNMENDNLKNGCYISVAKSLSEELKDLFNEINASESIDRQETTNRLLGLQVKAQVQTYILLLEILKKMP